MEIKARSVATFGEGGCETAPCSHPHRVSPNPTSTKVAYVSLVKTDR